MLADGRRSNHPPMYCRGYKVAFVAHFKFLVKEFDIQLKFIKIALKVVTRFLPLLHVKAVGR